MSNEFIKKVLVVFIYVCISSLNFAAVVSDNDGSAFITKAEFDSLKNTFQSQLDLYNTGIGSKIDNAIASYIAGIKAEQRIGLNLLYPVNNSTTYKPKMVKNKENTIKKQTFQGGLYYTAHWASWGAVVHDLSGFMPWANPYDYNFSQFALNGKGYYDQMEGWVFDKDNPTILTNKYGYDNCSLILSDTITWNSNYGSTTGEGADRWAMGIQPGTITGKKINTNYDSTAGIGNGNGNWGCGSNNAWATGDTISASFAKAHWMDELPMSYDFCHDGSVHSQVKSNSTQYSEDVWNIQYMFVHSVKNEDLNIYVYPYCKDVIYAHAADAVELEEYRDYMDDVSASNVIGGEYTNLYVTDKTERWMYWQREWDTTSRFIHPRRQWRFTPKFKLKNTTTNTSVKPNTASQTGGTKYWNTLDQFYNGKIVYKDHTGKSKSPRFYAGLPLIAISSDYEKFSFNIKISPTISSSVSNFCVRIMSEEFPNGNDIGAWTTSQKDALQKISGTSKTGDTITNYNYDETNNYLVIPKNTDVTITINKPASNMTYFLRWWEQGNADNAGGQIEYLGDGIATKMS